MASHLEKKIANTRVRISAVLTGAADEKKNAQSCRCC